MSIKADQLATLSYKLIQQSSWYIFHPFSIFCVDWWLNWCFFFLHPSFLLNILIWGGHNESWKIIFKKCFILYVLIVKSFTIPTFRCIILIYLGFMYWCVELWGLFIDFKCIKHRSRDTVDKVKKKDCICGIVFMNFSYLWVFMRQLIYFCFLFTQETYCLHKFVVVCHS